MQDCARTLKTQYADRGEFNEFDRFSGQQTTAKEPIVAAGLFDLASSQDQTAAHVSEDHNRRR